MYAVHLLNSYCLPIPTYAGGTVMWSESDTALDRQKLNVY
jgi:hypothetical protein